MATRQEMVKRATDLIKTHPSWGKDRINKELRSEFGKGLRRIEVAKLKRKIIAPVVREQALALTRYQVLRKEGFLPQEAEFYSRFAISQPGMQKVRRFRAKTISQARKAGIAQKKIPDYIIESYRARGFLDKQGKPIPGIWNQHVFNELEKPIKERKPVAIPGDRFFDYLKARKAKISDADSLQLAANVPPAQWAERMKQYRILRNAHFSNYEAMYFVTAATPKGKLQKLNLNTAVWQTAMRERGNWYSDQIKRAIAKGLTPLQAARAVMREVDKWYRADKRRNPYDEVELISPTGPPKPQIDFADAIKKRRARQAKKKMPFRVRRAT